jgi:hypothetical protein
MSVVSTAKMEAEDRSSLGRELVSGLIGAGVSMVCILPPILHLVTGPLGPFIGGFVAANRVSRTPRARIVVAVTVATALAMFVGGVLGIAASVASAGELPDWFPSSRARIVTLASIVWVYAVTLAAVGTVVRGAVGRGESK